jgi:hypothetical protein
MNDKMIAVRISETLYKKYKMLCVEMDLTISGQTANLIENFIQVQKDNVNLVKKLKKMGKE